jgi:leucyl-tRNA synthetase
VWRSIIDEETGEPVVSDEPASDELRRVLHRTIDGVRRDMDGLRFNTAIAKITELNNEVTKDDGPTPREVADAMVRMLAPLVPHVAEELWARLSGKGSVTVATFPEADPGLLIDDLVELPVQVNGKLRGTVTVPADADDDQVIRAALTVPNVAVHVEGEQIRKTIVVPGRLVNVVI